MTKITVELSPDMYLVLHSLAGFYKKEPWEVIELALEQLGSDVKLITTTLNAMKKV